MNILDNLFTNKRKNHMNMLIDLAKTNGLNSYEKGVLYDIGKKNGYSPFEIDKLIESENKYIFDIKLKSKIEKFDIIYDMVSLIVADDNIEEEELEYCNILLSSINNITLSLMIRKIALDIKDSIDKEETRINVEPFLYY